MRPSTEEVTNARDNAASPALQPASTQTPSGPAIHQPPLYLLSLSLTPNPSPHLLPACLFSYFSFLVVPSPSSPPSPRVPTVHLSSPGSSPRGLSPPPPLTHCLVCEGGACHVTKTRTQKRSALSPRLFLNATEMVSRVLKSAFSC
ncbi:hypothetical protein E2C01_072294 [Portunus trituberculatus]|uniref:Uncharacterized protein n=1 Tax=Portunus trituberculatus TaxID=210409 RepID=A0A5B7I8J7_PORTR|nr:hypothetical protein [Portunus trituberculatus]